MSEFTTEQRARVEDFVAALRSGEYAQCSNQLGKVSEDGVKQYCCEGVAVERYAAQVGHKAAWDGGPRPQLFVTDEDDDENSDYAEDAFWERLGLSAGPDNGTSTVFAFVLPEGKEVRDSGAEAMSYMALNDEGFTFEQIADILEWQFLSEGTSAGVTD